MLPAVFPKVAIVKRVPRGRGSTVRSLCRAAGIDCRVTGPAAERRIYFRFTSEIEIAREPGPFGSVSVGIPDKGDGKEQATLALGILAYAVFDYAARESMRGRPEARLKLPLGRPRKVRALSGAERQRRWRAASIENSKEFWDGIDRRRRSKARTYTIEEVRRHFALKPMSGRE
jgi:hypothetical protein